MPTKTVSGNIVNQHTNTGAAVISELKARLALAAPAGYSVDTNLRATAVKDRAFVDVDAWLGPVVIVIVPPAGPQGVNNLVLLVR